ncbi:MAG: hypothetical protein QOK30_1222, partial [Nocardioidaceae bacterium]|nr:hypothetical protein [Nocardioidaceae bacterium]
YVDGMVLQALVAGEHPDVATVEATLRCLVRGSAPGEACDLAVGARRPAGPVAGALD